MGFRSVLISGQDSRNWPEWLVAKYSAAIDFDNGLIRSRSEMKLYDGLLLDLFTDLQSAIGEACPMPLVVVCLHECGGVSRVEISPQRIQWTEPAIWRVVDEGGEHWHCYGCSDSSKAIGGGEVGRL